MPRCFFHVRDGDTLQRDVEGAVFETLELACEEAAAGAREIMAQTVLAGKGIDGRQFELTSDRGEVVKIIPFRSTLKPA